MLFFKCMLIVADMPSFYLHNAMLAWVYTYLTLFFKKIRDDQKWLRSEKLKIQIIWPRHVVNRRPSATNKSTARQPLPAWQHPATMVHVASDTNRQPTTVSCWSHSASSFVYTLCLKKRHWVAYYNFDRRPGSADDATPALILLTNWCYTKMASREIIIICILWSIVVPYVQTRYKIR